MELFVSLAFLSVFAGAIALLILVGKLVGKAIVKKVKGAPPVDPDLPPALRRSYTNAINAILVTLVIMGALSFAALYVVGSALANLR